jgi:RES domain
MSNTVEIRQKIRWLNRQDPSKLNFEQLKKTYREVLKGLVIPMMGAPAHEFYFRARVNPNKRPDNIKELMAPPPELVVGYQRCNGPADPMMYTASRTKTALLECGVKAGDVAYLSQWIAKSTIPTNMMLIPREIHNDEKLKSPLQELIYSYVDTLFTRRIDKSFSDDYIFTAAISDMLCRNFESETIVAKGSDNSIAFRYPSIVDIENSYNTVFTDVFAKQWLELCHLMEVRVIHSSVNSFEIEVRDNATDFSSGQIHWTGDPSKTPTVVGPNGGAPFISDGKIWHLVTNSEPHSTASLRALFDDTQFTFSVDMIS